MEERYLKFIARNKLRFFVGMGFLGIIMSIFGFLTFAKVWSSTFEYYGISPVMMYIIVPIGLVVLGWYLGYWYEMNNLWKYEVTHLNTNVNTEFEQMRADLAYIRGVLEKKPRKIVNPNGKTDWCKYTYCPDCHDSDTCSESKK